MDKAAATSPSASVAQHKLRPQRGAHRAARHDGAAAHGLVQRERDGCGAGVAVVGEVADHALGRHPQALRRAVQDALRGQGITSGLDGQSGLRSGLQQAAQAKSDIVWDAARLWV